MNCKSKTVRGARLIAVSVAVLCGLCVCFVSCNDDADEDVERSDSTYNSDGTLGSSGLSQSEWESLLSSISGESTIVLSSELTSEDLATFAAALIASGKTGIKLDLSSLSILSIAAGTFEGCTGITSVVLPESVVSIGEDAFSGCTSLVSITIGSSLVSVGEDAFSGCSALTLVTYSGTTDDWEEIETASGNEYLTGATVVCCDGRITGSGNTSATVTASYSGEGEDELSGVAIKVTASGGTISSVTIGGSTVSANSDGTYTYTVEGGSTSTVYTVTLVYDSTSGVYTYSYTSVVAKSLTASTTQTSIGSVEVKYSSDSGIVAVSVSGEAASSNGDGTYTYTVTDSDGNTTVYTLAISGEASSGYTYSYTYVATTTSDYTATGDISGVAVSVNATVVETYNGSSSTYTVASVNGVSAGDEELEATTDSDGNTTYSYTVEGTNTSTVYTITLVYDDTSDAYSYTYESAVEATVTASYSGSGTNALSGYTFTVTYATDTAGNTEITKVLASVSGASTQLSGSDGVYTLSVTGEGGYEALYTITFVYSNSAVSYTYSATAVEDAEATGGLPSSYGVHVKYTSSGTTYTVRALAIDDGVNPVTLSANSGGTYTYTVDSDGLYTSDADSVVTTYTITLVTSKAPTYTYTYTYVKTTTSDYTASGDISGVAVKVNATVSETYNGSSSTYAVDSVNGVSAASSSDSSITYEVSATGTDGVYTFTVTDSDTSSTTYTVTVSVTAGETTTAHPARTRWLASTA